MMIMMTKNHLFIHDIHVDFHENIPIISFLIMIQKGWFWKRFEYFEIFLSQEESKKLIDIVKAEYKNDSK